MTYEVIEKHNTYLTYRVDASSEQEALDKVDSMSWDEANEEETEFENIDITLMEGE